jgi:predicted ATPase
MFTKLYLENFLSFKGPIEVPLQKLTVLLGPNNAGKTNFLKAIRYLSLLTRANLGSAATELGTQTQDFVYRAADQPRFRLGLSAKPATAKSSWSSADYQIEVGFHEQNAVITAEDAKVRQSDGSTRTLAAKERALFVNEEKEDRLDEHRTEALLTSLGRDTCVSVISSLLRGVAHFHFSPAALRQPGRIVAGAKLAQDGAGLPAVLDRLRDTQPETFKTIEEHFRECVPEVSSIEFDAVQEGVKAIRFREKGFQKAFNAAETSDGLLLFLALLCCIHLDPAPALLCLEEPEHGVHPRRLKDVVDLLWSLAERGDGGEGTQIILTTHSPYFLDRFKDELDTVLLLDRKENGTQVRRASDIVKEFGGLHGSPLGELWYSGALGGVPQ